MTHDGAGKFPIAARMRRVTDLDLQRGGNASLSGGPLDLAVAGAQPGTVDLLVFQLGADLKVRSDDDLVFFNHPVSPEGAVRLVGGDRVTVDPATVPAGVERLAVAVALDAGTGGGLADVPDLGVTVADGTQRIVARAGGLTTERAAVLVEVYRRGDGWKVRSVSAGWSEGLAALVREHGVTVDDEPQAAPEPAVRTAPGEEKLSLVKRQQLDLRKREVHKVLLTKGAAGERARVLLVIDKTGSMQKQYRTKVVHRVVERMVPVAVQLDDDGTLEPYLYARSFARLPDLRVADLDGWPEEFLHLGGTHGGIDYNALGNSNDEIPIMTEIVDGLRGRRTPTLVLFFTDGGFSRRREITELIRTAAHLPAFWQFVGIGRANYGLLTKLDELPDRVVDNAGFFAVDDIDGVSDAELYQRLLSEFPDWLRAARAAGIVSA